MILKLMVASSSENDSVMAARNLAADVWDVVDRYGGEPGIIFVFADADYSAVQLRDELSSLFRNASIHGGSSCRGVLVGGGARVPDGLQRVGLLAIWNADGDQGTAISLIGADARRAAISATSKALENAGRPDEVPDLVWLTAAPGFEEQVLEGVKEVVGHRALIVGGSSADNNIAGNWFQFSRERVCEAGIVVSVLFSKADISSVYQNGHVPVGPAGNVTKAEGRRLVEINSRPAAEIYFNWLRREVPQVPKESSSVSVLSDTTFSPLGKVTGSLAKVPAFLLLHPAMMENDGTLQLFADVNVGDTVHLMQAKASSLIERAGKMAAQAKADIEFRGLKCAGELIVFCGGCLLAVEQELPEIQEAISRELGDMPFLVMFSFGEQGKGGDLQSHHANLMISCTAFGA